MPAACTCGAGCPVGACAASAACSCGFGAVGYVPLMAYGINRDYGELTPAQREEEAFWLKKHNEHVKEHVRKLSGRHFSYKGWAITPYVSDPNGYAEMRWKATKKDDRTYDGTNYAQVKLSILRYVDIDKWLHFLKEHI